MTYNNYVKKRRLDDGGDIFRMVGKIEIED